jgi:spore coat protein A
MTNKYVHLSLGIALMLVFVGSILMPVQLHAVPLDPNTLTKYIDQLPFPGVLTPVGTMNGAPYYEVTMSQFQQQLHSELSPSTVWGYNGSYPGPTMVAQSHQIAYVKWINQLPVHHLFAVDTSLGGAGTGIPEVRGVTHLHGGHVPSASDGGPLAWFVPGETRTYFYPNNQDATMIWYHDHAMGITRLNVYAGLAGVWLVRDQREAQLNLPSGQFEVPVVIQDRSFNDDGSLFYPDELVPEFFGNTALVNGKVWPYLDVQPRKYRLRFLNGCNARFLNIKLLESDSDGNIFDPEVAGPAFYQIGTDGGFLSAAAELNDPDDPMSPRLLLSPAERADCIVDFSGYEGRYFVLQNNAGTPFKYLGQPDDEEPLPDIMLFRVSDTAVEDPSSFPTKLPRVNLIPESSARMTRDLTLEEHVDSQGRLLLLLNGQNFNDPITELPQLGSTEIWRIINLTEDTHPIHLHLVFFQILDRQPFDVDEYNNSGNIVFTGPAVPPDPNEAGWKDTFRANPGQVARVIASYRDYTGDYVWHCHILEHEDHEMMRPFRVVKGAVMVAGAGNGNERIAPPVTEPTYSFQLNPNYPSPFNPTTTISFSLPEAAPTRLVVFDITGRTVATLADGWQEAGVHRVTFDGSQLASGVYFYQLTSGTQSQTHKMIMLK